jgi:hypothetical protein
MGINLAEVALNILDALSRAQVDRLIEVLAYYNDT